MNNFLIGNTQKIYLRHSLTRPFKYCRPDYNTTLVKVDCSLIPLKKNRNKLENNQTHKCTHKHREAPAEVKNDNNNWQRRISREEEEGYWKNKGSMFLT